MGTYFTRGLFYETTPEDKSSVVYTLKDEDHKGYPSLKRLYLEADDPTEYTFALAHLGGWGHWELLCECTWFKPYISQWRRELELKMKAEALSRIRELAAKDGKDKLTANRFIVEKGWEPKDGQTRRGRPTKSEISAEASKIAEDRSRILLDAERLNIQ